MYKPQVIMARVRYMVCEFITNLSGQVVVRTLPTKPLNMHPQLIYGIVPLFNYAERTKQLEQ